MLKARKLLLPIFCCHVPGSHSTFNECFGSTVLTQTLYT